MNTEKISKSPIYKLFGSSNNIYIKREDFIPISFGGNKARKALYFFNEIDNGNYDCVVTYGSSSSNHCRIIANMCAMRKMNCFIISPKEIFKETFNSKLMNLFGAEIKQVLVNEVHDTIENKLEDLKKQGKRPYFIQGGGHGNIGTQAYFDCYKEILIFEKKNNISFDYIFHASGTGTTQAGLVCGHLVNKDLKKIIGISIARKNPRGRNVVLDSINEYLAEKEIIIPQNIIEKETIFDDTYICDGYGSQDNDLAEFIKYNMINHSLPLDTTYTGKALWGMNDYIEKNYIKNKNILFIHTGGGPLFFDYLKGYKND